MKLSTIIEFVIFVSVIVALAFGIKTYQEKIDSAVAANEFEGHNDKSNY